MNRDMNDAQRSASQEAVSAELRTIHERLLEDGVNWRDDLPFSAMRATQELAEQTAPQGR